RFRALPRFERRPGCDLLRSFRLSGPVFGRRGVVVSFRTTEDVRYTLRWGRSTARRVSSGIADGTASAGATKRLRLRSSLRGVHRFRLTVTDGERTATATLRASRL
ncbi:MAG TPA: hypothetical protein VHF89_17430, partial [Solirubrobacteraceae bacterium]|nr:hypothetical protein [Solirubrobacteraceae bacterium]